jgi:hypothetical protein
MKNKREKKEIKKEGYYEHFTLHTVRRSRFAKHFFKTVSASSQNPLH